jgi:hypothetical protein
MANLIAGYRSIRGVVLGDGKLIVERNYRSVVLGDGITYCWEQKRQECFFGDGYPLSEKEWCQKCYFC